MAQITVPSMLLACAVFLAAVGAHAKPATYKEYNTVNTYKYHNKSPQTVLSFQGVYGSNFNETIFFCNFKPYTFELHNWHIVPVLAKSWDSGQSSFNTNGAILNGGVYKGTDGSIIWKGLGFSQNGPYDCAFTLATNGTVASGYYTFLDQLNETTPGGETGPWILYYKREPTVDECNSVYRTAPNFCGPKAC